MENEGYYRWKNTLSNLKHTHPLEKKFKFDEAENDWINKLILNE